MDSVLLRNVIIANGSFSGKNDILVEQGIIRAISPSIDNHSMDCRVFDCSEMIAFSAPIDNHVHFREPGDGAYKEGWETGSLAAMYGGITGVIDVQNSPPYLDSIEAFQDKLNLVRKKSLVDYAFYASVTNDNIYQLHQLAPYCAGFKLFMGQSTGKLGVNDPKKWLEIAKIAADTSTTLVVHAEDEKTMQDAYKANSTSHNNNLQRPPEAEHIAIRNAIRLCEQTGCSLHVFHVTTTKGLDLILSAEQRGLNVTSGVCPHHLIFSQEDALKNPSLFKVFPPLRSKYDLDGLREHLCNGNITVLQSDHAPHLLTEKQQPFHKAPGGLPGVQSLLTNGLRFISEELITISMLDKMLSSNPRKINNLPQYSIAPNEIARFTIASVGNGQIFSKKLIKSRAGWSIYEQLPQGGNIEHVFIGGSHTLMARKPHNPPLPLALVPYKTRSQNVDNL